MKKTKKFLALSVFILFLSFTSYLYFTQEKRIFRHQSLPKEYSFQWDEPFKEFFIPVNPKTHLNALYFPSKQKKGLVFYLHGRGGNLAHPWGEVAGDFTKRGYDFFIFDYRGFGKSDGEVSNQKVLLSDVEKVYRFALEEFKLKNIIIYGRSLGTGPATYLSAKYNPQMLLLESPYLNLIDIAAKTNPYLPKFLVHLILKYPLRIDRWIGSVNCPIFLFHGTNDSLIPYHSSLSLEKIYNGSQPLKVTLLDGVSHNHVNKDEMYQITLDQILL